MKVLVLGSDPEQLKLVHQALERAEHEMVAAENVSTALNLLAQGEIRFVIVDGAEDGFIARVRAAKLASHVYILVIVSRSPEQDRAGADDFIYKPFTAADLKSRIAIGERIMGLGDNLSQARDQLENLALLDGLTSLMNQKAFLSAARGELERARRTQSPFSLIALNIKDYGHLTEFHGQQTADNVLRLIAQMIQEKSRPYDCLGRWQADEFFIALPAVIGADAEKFVERIISGIRSTTITTTAGLTVHVELGAGIVAASRISASMEIEELIHQAAQALLRVKDSVGHRIALTYV